MLVGELGKWVTIIGMVNNHAVVDGNCMSPPRGWWVNILWVVGDHPREGG